MSARPGRVLQDPKAVTIALPHIPDYDLLRRIGQGAFGEVWLARAVTGQLRAVKIVRREALPSQRSFEREFEGLVRYEPVSRTQANLVQVLHVGRAEDGRSFWYVMELADAAEGPDESEVGDDRPEAVRSPREAAAGAEASPESYRPRTLRSVLRQRGRLPVSECLRLALGLTQATAHLHGHGLVHRDIKPSNVIFVAGQPKLADVGLVTATEEQPSFVGTAGYIPPEGAGTPAADIYALGRVFYEMATGRPVRDFPRLPEDLQTGPDRGLVELNEIILRAGDLDVRRRYSSIAYLRSDLLLLEAGHSVRRWRGLERRLRLLARAGAAVTAVALVSIALGVWANRERLRALKAEQELSARFIEQQLALARATRLTGLPGQREATLAIVRDASRRTNSLALRNEAIAGLALPDARYFCTVQTGGAGLAFDRSMRRYATNDSAGNLVVRRLEDGHLIASLRTKRQSETSPALGLSRFDFCAQDECLCAAYTNRQVLIWDLGPVADQTAHPNPGLSPPAATTVEARLVPLWFEPRNLTVVPGGSLIAVEGGEQALHLLDVRNGRQVHEFELPRHVAEVVFSADGSRFSTMQDNVLTIQDARSGDVCLTLTNSVPLGGMAWHPDGLQMVTWAWPGQRTLQWWNLVTGRCSGTLRGHLAEVTGAAFDASGQWLVSASWDNQTVLWNVAQQTEILRWPGAGNLIRLSADAQRLAWRSWDHREWKILEVTPPIEVVRLEQHPGLETPEGLRSLWSLAFLDGELLAGAGDEGFSLWQPPQGYASALAETGLERPLFASPALGFFSSGRRGLRRWPMVVNPGRNELSIGPAERFAVPQPSAFGYFVFSTNGLRTALVTTNRQLFVHTERDGALWRELAGSDTYGVSIDPGGRYVAASFRAGGVRIWDAQAGSLITNLPCSSGLGCEVSPDGQWLSVQTLPAFQIWRVADWDLAHSVRRAAVSGPVQAWSPDSRILLVHDQDSSVRLLRAGTWEELGSLPAPKLLHQPLFSPDSTRLALPSEKSGVELWDLRRVRERLAELGLDWKEPPYRLLQAWPGQARRTIQVEMGR